MEMCPIRVSVFESNLEDRIFSAWKIFLSFQHNTNWHNWSEIGLLRPRKLLRLHVLEIYSRCAANRIGINRSFWTWLRRESDLSINRFWTPYRVTFCLLSESRTFPAAFLWKFRPYCELTSFLTPNPTLLLSASYCETKSQSRSIGKTIELFDK